jgi:hypothetical protein
MNHRGNSVTDAGEMHRRMNIRSIRAQVPTMIHCGDPDVMIIMNTATHVHVMCGECHQSWSIPA